MAANALVAMGYRWSQCSKMARFMARILARRICGDRVDQDPVGILPGLRNELRGSTADTRKC